MYIFFKFYVPLKMSCPPGVHVPQVEYHCCRQLNLRKCLGEIFQSMPLVSREMSPDIFGQYFISLTMGSVNM
jgi:hypothetical protein